MSEAQTVQPKVFCSYCWTNQEYQNRIIFIAERLIESGIDVLLDKWDLVEGADTHAYMEKAISDKSVTHVLIFSDSGYAQKADSRIGGVGKETLIITPEVYGQEDVTAKEQRYLPIVMEKDASGNAFLPVYLRGRYYIDMSTDDLFNDSFEQLVRAIFGKPIYRKPQLGKAPSYIQSDNTHQTGLSILKNSAITALRDHKPYSLSRCTEYFEAFVSQLEKLRLNDTQVGKDFDDIIVSHIDSMAPMKDECFDVISTIIKEFKEDDFGDLIHTFFENFINYTQWPENATQWNESKADHFKFVLYELYLYSVACCLKYNNDIILSKLLSDYYCRIRFVKDITSYDYIARMDTPSLKHRNSRLGLHRVSLKADFIAERVKSRIDLKLEHIMQADLFLFLQSRIHGNYWYPFTLVYAAHQDNTFEIFAKAQAKDKCRILLKLLGCNSVEDLKRLFVEDEIIAKYSPTGWTGEVNLKALSGLDRLGTRD